MSAPPLRVRAATAEDAAALGPRLRDADRNELVAATGGEPAAVLAQGVAEADEAYAVIDRDDRVVALFGLRADPCRDDAGRPWLLASDDLAAHATHFLRECRGWVRVLHRRHRVLWNLVDARNETHVAWLEFCGFRRVCTLERHGPEARPFHQYAREREAPVSP